MWILTLKGLNGKTINLISSTDLTVMVTNNLFRTWSRSKRLRRQYSTHGQLSAFQMWSLADLQGWGEGEPRESWRPPYFSANTKPTEMTKSSYFFYLLEDLNPPLAIELILTLQALILNSYWHPISPNTYTIWSYLQGMRMNEMITMVKCLDVWTNSLQQYHKKCIKKQ